MKAFMNSDGTIYKQGDRIFRPNLGNTLELVAQEGSDAFYKVKTQWLLQHFRFNDWC